MKSVLLLFFFSCLASDHLLAQRVKNLGSNVNSDYDEISPCLSPEGLFFVRSNHPENTFGENDSQDIWYSKGSDTTWAKAVHLPINNARYNSVLSILSDGSLLINGVFNKKGNFWSKRGMSICKKQGSTWGAPESIGLNALTHKSEGIFGGGDMSADGNKIVAAFSKRLNSKKSDLFLFTKSPNGKWNKMEKLKEINTEHSEENPSFSANGKTIYFSSDRGGNFDIYQSMLVKGHWSKPALVDLGDIDYTLWESSFRIDPDGEWGYFSSNHAGLGKSDIFRVRMPGKKDYIVVKGSFFNAQTKSLMKGENITLLADGNPPENAYVSPDSSGYRIQLPKNKGKTLVITAVLPHYKGIPRTIEIGYDDVNDFNLELQPPSYAIISGKILIKGTSNPVPVKDIRAILLNGSPVDSVTLDTATSSYSMKVPIGKKHKISVDANQYSSDVAEADLELVTNFVKKEVDLFAEKHHFLRVVGKLLDKVTNAPIPASKHPRVIVENNKSISAVYDSLSGKFQLTTEPGKYVVTGIADSYFPASEAGEGKTNTTVEKNIFLIPSVVGKPIQLNHILFVLGKAILLPTSNMELDNLLTFMEQNPQIKILIGGHTDSQGSYTLNKKLSKARAAAVRDFLMTKGISNNRLESEGYGPDKPVASNKTDMGRRLNRRVEITVLK